MTQTAEELYSRGVDLVNRGRYRDARRVLVRAADRAQRVGDADLGARITGTTAYLVTRTGEADEGARMVEDALAHPGLSAHTRAILHGQLGLIDVDRGYLDTATSWLDRSIDGLADDPVRCANMRMNRSLVNMYRGRFASAIDDLERAEDAYRAADLPAEADQAVHNRAYVAMLEGDLVTALTTMRGVRASLNEESDVWAAINELDHAEVLRDAGLTTEAEQSLERVIEAFGRHRIPQERAKAEFQLARSLLNHDPARAARVAATAVRRFRAAGSDGWMLRADAVRLRALLAVGRLDRAGTPIPVAARLPSVALVSDVVAGLERAGLGDEAAALRFTEQLARLRLAARRVRVGGERRGNRRTDEAGAGDARADEARERPVRVRRGASLEVVTLAHEVRAERARAAGREALSRRLAAQGVDLVEQTRQSVGSLDFQASGGMHALGLLTMGLASAVRSRRPDVVFEWAERARHMSLQTIPLRPPPDADAASDLAELRLLRSENPGADWFADARATELRDRARERQWSQTGSAGVRARVDLHVAQAALDAETAVLGYVFDGGSLVALVATREKATMIPLDWTSVRAALTGLRADLEVSASVRAGPLAEVVRGARDNRLARLSELLLREPLAAAGDAPRIVVTTPGVLTGVPWMMLPPMRGRTVTVASSVSQWVHDRTEHLRVGDVGIAVGPRVTRGDEEGSVAADAWAGSAARARVLRDDAATVDAVTTLASSVDVLHVAAHGRHAADNPLFSGLELADGALFGYDIDQIPDLPSLVVLSACEVGRSAVRWGEEAVGMTRTWLHAGARCVIAAPVTVADDVACELLGAIHSGLFRGESPSEALAQASVRTGLVTPFQCHGSGF